MKLTEAKILSVDTETTGVDHETDRICEVGWSRVRFSEEHKVFYSGVGAGQLINPKRSIPAVAMAVHHITDQMVSGSPTVEEWDKKLKADLFVAHNAPFDRGFMVQEGLVDEDALWLDTYRLAKHLLPNAPSYGNQVLRYHLGFYDVPGDAHSAGHDAAVTAMIFCHMLNEVAPSIVAHYKHSDGETKRFSGLDAEALITLAEQPVFLTGTAGFGKYKDKTWREILRLDRGYLQWMARQGQRSASNPDGWNVDVWYTIHELLEGRTHEDRGHTA